MEIVGRMKEVKDTYSPSQIGKAIMRVGPNIEHIYLNGRLPGHPAKRNKKMVLCLHIVLPIGRTIASEITDFDMIAFADQAVPEKIDNN